MMEWIFLLTVLLASKLASTDPQSYRDYEYNRKTNAFYKIHIEERNLYYSRDVCSVEGAKLMVPSSTEDIAQVHGMLKRYPDIGRYVWVEFDGNDHDSAEEPLIVLPESDSNEPVNSFSTKCNVINRYDGEIEDMPCTRRLPFVCKVEAKDVPYDAQCDVYSVGYDYFSSVGSCYKVPNIAYTWNEAYSECDKVGAHLVVINSEAEHKVVHDVVRAAKTPENVQAFFFFFAGFRAERPAEGQQRVFKTVFNETLEQAGYDQWADGEPNNYRDMEYCGTIFYNDGKFNDADCNHLYAFVCEKEVTKKNK